MSGAGMVVDFIQFVDVLHTEMSAKTNRLVAQVGSVIGRTVDSVNVEWWQQLGLASRASKPVGGKQSARGVMIRKGATSAIIATEDDRGLALLGNLADGETCLYAAGSDGNAQARVLLKADGSVNVVTTDTNTADGTNVVFAIRPDGLTLTAPWGTFKFDSTGFHVTHASGASLNLGGIYGMPPPLDKLGTYFDVTAASIGNNSTVQHLGTGAVDPLAKSTPLNAALSNLQAQINAIGTALTAISAATTPATSPAAATAVAAITAGAASLTATELLIPSTTASP